MKCAINRPEVASVLALLKESKGQSIDFVSGNTVIARLIPEKEAHTFERVSPDVFQDVLKKGIKRNKPILKALQSR